MHKLSLAPWLVISFILMALSGCAGKEKPSPADVETAAFEDLRSEVHSVIKDPNRSQQALALIDKLQLSFSTLRDHLNDRRARMKAVNADYDVSKEDVVSFIYEIQEEMAYNQQQISILHRQLVEVTTAKEWSQLAKSKSTAMVAAIDSIRTI
ncbi:MAG: hypothetical protein ABJL54_07600 [Halioglobus sp.]